MSVLSYVIRKIAGRGIFKDLYPDTEDDQNARSTEIARVERQIDRMRKYRESLEAEVDSKVKSLKALNDANHYGEAIARALSGKGD